MFFTLFFLCFNLATAQEDHQEHTVVSGETLTSIAKKYNVTPYDLQQANPGVISNFKLGDVLIIPTSKIKTPVVSSLSDSLKASVKRSSISYTVKKGDTKFSLSKRFGVTIPELEAQNPQIVSGLQTEQVLAIYGYPQESSTSQTPVTTTQEPVAAPIRTFSGEKSHVVIKGETLYSISQANGLTVAELTNANSSVLSGILKEGQRLKIPTDGQPTETAKYETYVVQKGDSKYGLSKKFDVSISDLERENPQIIAMLVEGHRLRIPSSTATDQSKIQTPVATTPEETNPTTNPVVAHNPEPRVPVVTENEVSTEQPETNVVVSNDQPQQENNAEQPEPTPVTKPSVNSNQNYINYQIKPKETLFGLSKRAGMTIPDFLVLNPQLKESVQIGAIIKMPTDASGATTETTAVISNPVKSTTRYADLKATANTAQSKNILFFLPFSQTEFQNHSVNGYDFENVADDFKRNHLEFYQGASIAMDSLKKNNLNLAVKIMETVPGQKNSKIMEMAKEHNINDFDGIVLPFYDHVEEDIAALTEASKTPVITASTIAHQSNTNNLYSALPSINQQRLKTLNYMKAKQAHIIVLTDVNRAESKAFIQGHIPNADFVNIKSNGTFNQEELISKFKKNQLNFVVLDSERNSVFLSATTTMLTELSNYKLQLAVLEGSLIPDGDDVSQMRFRILKMIYPSLTPASPTSYSKQFVQTYQKKYKMMPSKNVMLGFDITFDSLLRMLQQDSFQNSAEQAITEYTSLKFDYDKNAFGGFSNEGIYILQYDAEANLKEAN